MTGCGEKGNKKPRIVFLFQDFDYFTSCLNAVHHEFPCVIRPSGSVPTH